MAIMAGLCSCGPKFQTVAPDDFQAAIADENVQLVDVRTAEEFAEKHIPGAVLFDVYDEAFVQNCLDSLDKTRPVAIYCRSGKRGADASGKLAKAGFAQVMNLDGGILGWIEAGKTVADQWDYIVFDGDEAPDFAFEIYDAMSDYDEAYMGGNGPFRKLSDLRGKVVLLQFTASWCGVCRNEMPHLEKDIWLKHQANPKFEYFAIDRDEPVRKIARFQEVTGVTYPFVFDPEGKIFDKFAIHDSGITRNVLIDPEGKIVLRTRLYDEESFAALVAKVDELLQ